MRLVIEPEAGGQAGPVRLPLAVGRGHHPVEARDAVVVLGPGPGGPADEAAEVPLGHGQLPGEGTEPDVRRVARANTIQGGAGEGGGARWMASVPLLLQIAEQYAQTFARACGAGVGVEKPGGAAGTDVLQPVQAVGVLARVDGQEVPAPFRPYAHGLQPRTRLRREDPYRANRPYDDERHVANRIAERAAGPEAEAEAGFRKDTVTVGSEGCGLRQVVGPDDLHDVGQIRGRRVLTIPAQEVAPWSPVDRPHGTERTLGVVPEQRGVSEGALILAPSSGSVSEISYTAARPLANFARRGRTANPSGGCTEMGRRVAICGAALATLAAAGSRAGLAGQAAWSELLMTIEARDSRLEPYLGRDALVLHNGTAWLDGVTFRDGVVEFDLAAPATLGFYGLAFRAQDEDDYEHIYLRPFLSGNPDATQYTPVFNGLSGWQIYAGPGYAGAVTIAADRWVHVRIAVRGQRAEVSVDGQTIVFPRLERLVAEGGLGLTASGAPGRFANLLVRADTAPAMEGGPGAAEDTVPTGTVRRWRVSTPFPETRLELPRRLDPAGWDDLEWSALDAGVRGIANLARLRPHSPERNTVFAAVTLTVDSARSLGARFGFSDRVVVYLNGQPLYRGADGWRSRDYRFLGTVGLFDELILPLRAGENELVLAVSESFGGWGVTLALPDATGVTVSPR